MHRRFERDRLNGEWFSPSRELIGFVNDLNFLLEDMRKGT